MWFREQVYSGQTRDLSRLMEPRAATSKTLIQTHNACAVKETCLKRDDGGAPAPKTGKLSVEVDDSKIGTFLPSWWVQRGRSWQGRWHETWSDLCFHFKGFRFVINFKVHKWTTNTTTNKVQTLLNLWAHTRPLSVWHSTACQQYMPLYCFRSTQHN